MRIKDIINQNRRDFNAIYECDHCGHTLESYGYDDENFHQNVVPEMVCPECGKKADDTYYPLRTKYPDGMVV